MTLVELGNTTAPPRLVVELELSGRRSLQDRDTVAVVEGARDEETHWAERWTFVAPRTWAHFCPPRGQNDADVGPWAAQRASSPAVT